MQSCQHWMQSWATSLHVLLWIVVKIAEPFISPLLFTMTPCSLQNKTHRLFSSIPAVYHCWMYLLPELWFAFLYCGHHHAGGSLFSPPLIPFTEMINRFLAPVLSAQLITGPTERPRESQNSATEDPPRPYSDILNAGKGQKKSCTFFFF